MSDGAVGVLEAQPGVDGHRGGGSAAGGRRHQRSGVGAVAGGVDAVDGRRLVGVDGDGAVVAQLAAERAGDVVAQPPADVEEQRVAVERLTVAEPDAAQSPVVAVQRRRPASR